MKAPSMIACKMIAASLLTLVFVTGCSGKAFEYHSHNEIPAGAGMFSGKDGAFTLYSDTEKKTIDASPASEACDFQTYRRWRDANGDDSPAYREFSAWRAWQASQSANASPSQ